MRYLKNVGDHGEEFAVKILEDKGYDILERKYRTRYGEIDIIACHEGVLHFIEVKTRTGDTCGSPADAVNLEKQSRMRRSAEIYLNRRHSYWRSISLDVLEILVNFIQDCV